MKDAPAVDDSPTAFWAIATEFFGDIWRASRALSVMGAVVILTAGIVANPLVLLSPIIMLVLPVMRYWHRAGVLAEIKPWQTHTLTFAAAWTVGVFGGVCVQLWRPSALTESNWSTYLLAVSVGLAMLVTVFRATAPTSDAAEAGRALLIAGVMLMVGLPAWITHLVREGDGVAGQIAGIVLSGSVVTAAWIVVVTLPRRSSRSGYQPPSAA